MRALVFNKTLKYKSNYKDPVPRKGEALIRITHAGICNTDLEITRGYMGFQGVPGHEFVGVVEECKKKGLAGKRVVGEININCGTCPECQNNLGNHCRNRSVLGILNKDGVFAEYLTLPVNNLHTLPSTVSDEEAVFIEPLASAFELLEQIDINSSHKVCVLGDGKLGMLVSQVLASTGCDLIVSGHHREKLSILDEMDIKTTRNVPLMHFQFDIVVDCTGSKTGIETALDIVKPKGTVVVKTTSAKKGNVDLNKVVVNEITLMGSRCGPFPPAIKAISERHVDLYPMVSRKFPLEDGIKAFQYASQRGSLKVLIEI
ncbi:MAG: alcohol dehydrogenase catalytic domain-containing protein [Nitrospiraceae bacterium]|nr:MAG: alcohol dehydrogenase catalytic domain-containing protein [Nitrospiraceae bacterium]